MATSVYNQTKQLGWSLVMSYFLLPAQHVLVFTCASDQKYFLFWQKNENKSII